MYKLEFFIAWAAFYICRIFLVRKNSSPSMLLVSFFLTVVPLQVNIPIGKSKFTILSGPLGSQMYVFTALILFVCFISIFQFRLKAEWKNSRTYWIWAIIGLLMISFINPNNENQNGTLIALVVLLSHVLFFNLLYSNISYLNVIRGMYDGFLILGIANFILAICFPILNLKIATTLFHATGDIGATRMGSLSRAGAIGFFVHPGALALYSTISSVLFLYYIMAKQRVKLSKFIFVLNLITIVLTFSRTTYLVYSLVIFTTYYIIKYPKRSIFSSKNVFSIFLPLAVFFLWIIVFSPLNSLFLESDVNTQFDNRALHWLMSIEAFKQSPLIGVGFNTHLIYFSKHPSVLKNLEVSPFFLENPIHNIHLIVLVELGLIGLVGWLFFLIKSVSDSKRDISKGLNVPLSITQVATILVFIFYGLTGWAPFSLNIIPYFLFIMYFTSKYRGIELSQTQL